ncbi:hypothetical protein TorRG33x02_262350, partial [Trema orientale]
MRLDNSDKLRNGNIGLTASRKNARTTKASVPSPFESVVRKIEGSCSKPFVKE